MQMTAQKYNTISIYIFCSDSSLGFSTERSNIKRDRHGHFYSWNVHEGVKGQVVPYKKTVKVRSKKGTIRTTAGQKVTVSGQMVIKPRKGIFFLKRAVDEMNNQIVDYLNKNLRFKFENDQYSIDIDSLKENWMQMANLIKSRAQSIVRAEAYDTGNLMKSISLSELELR